jgi:hypothetical protein
MFLSKKKLNINILIKIFFYFPIILAVTLIKLKSKKLCKKISQKFKGPYIFKPYGLLDCFVLHEGIKKNLNKKLKTQLLKEVEFEINYLKFIKIKKFKNGFSGFQNFLRNGCIENNIKNFYYPLLDTYIRIIPWKFFFSGFELKKNFFEEIKKIIEKYEKFYLNYNTLFLADTAYFDNYLAKYIFLKKNKKVIYLNPNGKIAQYCNINYSEFSGKNFKNSYNKYSTVIKNYLFNRYIGQSNNDKDTKFSFSQNLKKRKNIIKKKVLFLHAFRDANNITWNKNQVFDSYIEWTEFTLNAIYQKGDFKNWYIKKHPSGKYYENENEILNKLIRKYNVPYSAIKDCPSTNEILDHKMPIYSNKGTIILETATKGYGTYFCNLRFNKKYGFFISSKKEWKKIVNTPYKRAANNNISKNCQQAAQYKLWQIYKKNIPELCPTRVIWRDNYFTTLIIILRQSVNTIVLKSKKITITKIE